MLIHILSIKKVVLVKKIIFVERCKVFYKSATDKLFINKIETN